MRKYLIRLIVLAGVLVCHDSCAKQRIAVLNFELNDITSLPNTAQEGLRTAGIKPLLEQVLTQQGDYDIIEISAKDQNAANAGFGYLYDFHDVVAKLAKQNGADWVVVGQHSKPSFLFSYLMVQLIDVKLQTLLARYEIELKGNHASVTQYAVNALADKIRQSLVKRRN